METIAVYRETRVKIYGITGKPGLAMGTLRFPVECTAFWGRRIMELENTLKRFELVTCHDAATDMIELHLIFEDTGRDTILALMSQSLAQETAAQFTMNPLVDMVYLHGPHFQDRFGIVETAFAAMIKNNIQIVHSGCAGTSMYLVLPENQGTAAMKILADTFLIPTTT